MRLFVAFDLPEDVKARLVRPAAEIPDHWPRARWVRPSALHLTLAFLGEQSPEMVPSIDRALQPVFADFPVTRARIGGAGAFPTRGKARVLWRSLEADADLSGLQRRVALALSAVKRPDGTAIFVPEKRAFTPHVTLARRRQPWPRWVVEEFIESVGEDPVHFELGRGTLFESELGPGGARYDRRSIYPMAPCERIESG